MKDTSQSVEVKGGNVCLENEVAERMSVTGMARKDFRRKPVRRSCVGASGPLLLLS
jgi:hypothetical protein